MSKLRDLFIKNLMGFLSKKDMSQFALANKMNVKPPSLIPYLKGRSAPTLDKLEGIARALGIEPFELLLPTIPAETPTVSGLIKTIEKQAMKLDGNEELLETWSLLDKDQKELFLKQMKMISDKRVSKKIKA